MQINPRKKEIRETSSEGFVEQVKGCRADERREDEAFLGVTKKRALLGRKRRELREIPRRS